MNILGLNVKDFYSLIKLWLANSNLRSVTKNPTLMTEMDCIHAGLMLPFSRVWKVSSDLLGRMDTIYKGLVREYDVLWGLLVLIPDVKED